MMKVPHPIHYGVSIAAKVLHIHTSCLYYAWLLLGNGTIGHPSGYPPPLDRHHGAALRTTKCVLHSLYISTVGTAICPICIYNVVDTSIMGAILQILFSRVIRQLMLTV